MEKKELKERLNEVKNQLRTNAKDVHFFDKLFDDALSLKGQLSIEPVALDCGKELDEWAGETFRITLTNKGVLYHEYGGYSVFVTPNNTALYEVLADLVTNKEEYAKLEGEHAENFLSLVQIITYNLSIPRLAFLDFDFARDISIKAVEFIKEAYEKLMEQPLKEETIEEDRVFKESAVAFETLNNMETQEA